MNRLIATVAAVMIMMPIALETMPIAFFQDLRDGLLWYGAAFALVYLIDEGD